MRANIRQNQQLLGRRFMFYSIYGWGVPFVIVIIGQILDNVEGLPENTIKPQFGVESCWFCKKF
jgi:hypothetical protein